MRNEAAATLAKLKMACEDEALEKVELIQPLWSGFGELARYYSPRLGSPLIVKQVSVPEKFVHPKGWNTDASRIRKLTSYRMEANFYRDFAAQCTDQCRVPQLYELIEDDDSFLLIMEDLHVAGYSRRIEHPTLMQVESVVSWLASFHARFMHCEGESVWPVGSYWHLATRQDEYASMPDNALKAGAEDIDRRLSSSAFVTLIHGDAKLANCCFHRDSDAVALVDFQYVGKGVGVKDLAYFLGCCLDSEQLFQFEEFLLDLYFTKLRDTLSQSVPSERVDQLEREWRDLYPLAWADFYRFLQGWSANHWKINSYMQSQTNRALEALSGGVSKL